MPSISRLSIAPIKGLALMHPTSVELTDEDVVEDRLFFVVDSNGRLCDGKLIGELVSIEPWTDATGSSLRLTLPTGETVAATVKEGASTRTKFLDRTLLGHEVEGPWAELLSDFTGVRLRLIRRDRGSPRLNNHAASMASDGSVRRLARELGVTNVDLRRFRHLIDLEGAGEHEEDTWIGRRIALGETVLRVGGRIPRCAVPTHHPVSGVRDLDVLRAIRSYRGLRDGRKLDFGVHADVETAGRIAIGDVVHVLE